MLLTLETVFGVCLSLNYFELYGRDGSHAVLSLLSRLTPVSTLCSLAGPLLIIYLWEYC